METPIPTNEIELQAPIKLGISSESFLNKGYLVQVKEILITITLAIEEHKMVKMEFIASFPKREKVSD